MSRVENRIKANNKKNSYKKFFRFTFILLMICIMGVCLFEIDKNATLMFGEVKNYNLEIFINNLGDSLNKTLNSCHNKISSVNSLIKQKGYLIR